MVAEYHQLSSCDTLNQLQHRRVLVKDDNYITHTYAVLDARKQTKGTNSCFITDNNNCLISISLIATVLEVILHLTL